MGRALSPLEALTLLSSILSEKYNISVDAAQTLSFSPYSSHELTNPDRYPRNIPAFHVANWVSSIPPATPFTKSPINLLRLLLISACCLTPPEILYFLCASKKIEIVAQNESAHEVRVEYEEFKTQITALFLAAHFGNLVLVRKLLNYGAFQG
ncbi:hypothetical protein ACFX2I_027736 [Malus domestica]